MGDLTFQVARDLGSLLTGLVYGLTGLFMIPILWVSLKAIVRVRGTDRSSGVRTVYIAMATIILILSFLLGSSWIDFAIYGGYYTIVFIRLWEIHMVMAVILALCSGYALAIYHDTRSRSVIINAPSPVVGAQLPPRKDVDAAVASARSASEEAIILDTRIRLLLEERVRITQT